MALLECSKCGGQVSDRAERCPHCGQPVTGASPQGIGGAAPVRHRRAQLAWLIPVAVILLAAGVAIGVMVTKGDPPASVTPQPATASAYDKQDLPANVASQPTADPPANDEQDLSASPSPQPAVNPRPAYDIIGKWEQRSLNPWTGKYEALARFRVIQTQEGYEMGQLESIAGTHTSGIANVQFDGDTWTFDSDWGPKGVAHFTLRKVSDDAFHGEAYLDGKENQKEKWVRLP